MSRQNVGSPRGLPRPAPQGGGRALAGQPSGPGCGWQAGWWRSGVWHLGWFLGLSQHCPAARRRAKGLCERSRPQVRAAWGQAGLGRIRPLGCGGKTLPPADQGRRAAHAGQPCNHVGAVTAAFWGRGRRGRRTPPPGWPPTPAPRGHAARPGGLCRVVWVHMLPQRQLSAWEALQPDRQHCRRFILGSLISGAEPRGGAGVPTCDCQHHAHALAAPGAA